MIIVVHYLVLPSLNKGFTYFTYLLLSLCEYVGRLEKSLRFKLFTRAEEGKKQKTKNKKFPTKFKKNNTTFHLGN